MSTRKYGTTLYSCAHILLPAQYPKMPPIGYHIKWLLQFYPHGAYHGSPYIHFYISISTPILSACIIKLISQVSAMWCWKVSHPGLRCWPWIPGNEMLLPWHFHAGLITCRVILGCSVAWASLFSISGVLNVFQVKRQYNLLWRKDCINHILEGGN